MSCVPELIQALRTILPVDGVADSASLAPSGEAPAAVSDLAATPASTSVALTWTHPAGATATVYRRDVTAAGSFASIASGVTEPPYNDTGRPPENAYQYKITLTNEFGTSADSNTVSTTTTAITGASGGTAETLAWNAPTGLVDGETLVVSSSTHTFTQPDKFIWLGFGDGWLYDNADDTVFPQTLAVGAEEFTYEYGIGSEARKIASLNSRKWLYTDFLSTENPSRVGAGMINWDTGADLVPGDRTYMFKVSRMAVETGPTNFQWKAERIGPGENLPTGEIDWNSSYVKHFGSTGPIITARNGSGSDNEFYFEESMNKLGIYSMQGWQWLQNTPDASDGGMITHGSRISGTETYAREIPGRSGPTFPTNIITTGTTFRPRWFKMQDYIGNVVSSENIELWLTDLYWQLNGSLFVIADNAVLADAQVWTPVVPISFDGGNQWTLKLWRGMLSDYTGAYLHLLDDELNVTESVPL